MMEGSFLAIVGVVALEVSLFALAVIAFDKLAPARWVRERHNLALGGFLLLPILFLFASQPGKPATRVAPEHTTYSAPAFTSETISPAPIPVIRENLPVLSSRSLPVETEAASSGFSLPTWEFLIALWLAGAALMLIRLAQDLTLLNGLRRRSQNIQLPETLRLSCKVSVRRSDEVDAPMVAGLIHPAIIVPVDFRFDARARCVLEHEIAHIKRGDTWSELLIRVLTSLFWWVAPLHMLHAIVRRTRETLCDVHSVDTTGAPADLAHALLDAASRAIRAPTLALSAAPTRSTLTARIDHLTSDKDTPRRTIIMRMPFVLPAIAVLAYAATPQLGVARESADEENQILVTRDQEVDGEHTHIHLDEHDFDFDLDFDFSELEARLEEMDFAELDARLVELDIELQARIAELDFSELEEKMAALEVEIEARMAEMNLSALENMDFSEIEARIQEMDFAGLEADIQAQVEALELEQLTRLSELESLIELDILAALGDLSELEKLAHLHAEAAVHDHFREQEAAYHAARRGDLAELRSIQSEGGDLSAASLGDGTPLMGAIRGGHMDVVTFLLSQGVDVNVHSPGDGTALIAAARHDNAEMVEMLLQAGADANLGVPGDGNPLIGAAFVGSTDIARRLITAGADPDGYVPGDETPLINAALMGNMEVAEMLVQAGADISLTVSAGHRNGSHQEIFRSPLSEAERGGNGDIVAWLQSMGAEHRPPAR